MAKTPLNVRELARAHTMASIEVLAGYVNAQQGVEPGDKIRAAQALLDRGWGKPAQPVTGENAEGPIVVQIIQKVRERK